MGILNFLIYYITNDIKFDKNVKFKNAKLLFYVNFTKINNFESYREVGQVR